MKLRLLLIAALVFVSCGDDDNNVAQNPNNADNNTSGSNNATNNTSGSSNANNTSGSNNGSNGSSNNTTGQNNTTGPNNTTGSNNGTNNAQCTPLDPALGDCDPLCQTGCDVGEHCLVDVDAATMETTAACGPAGPRTQNDVCTSDTECAVGLHCRSVAGGNRTCLNYCNPTGVPDCPANHACVRLQGDVRIGACVPIEDECEAVPTDTCADPDECYDTIQGTRCLPAGDAIADEECSRSSDCAAGLRCVSIMDVGLVCKPICDPNGGDDQCADGACRSLADPDGSPLSWGACF